MTTTVKTCTPLHEAHDALGDRREALAEELKAAYRPAQKGFRDLNDAEKTRAATARERLEAVNTDLRKSRRAIEDAHDAVKCAGATPGGYTGAGDNGAKSLMADLDAKFNLSGTATRSGAKGGDHRWSQAVKADLGRRDAFGDGRKALSAPGAVLVPTVLDGEIVRDGERPSLIRQLLPVEALTGTDRFAWMQQVLRENNAAPVARGEKKPTSRFTVAWREDRVRVVAHLSEPIDRVHLEDSAALTQFVDAEMRLGVVYASEEQILTGDGTGENLTGLLETEGISVQPFAGDRLASLRKAITRQQQAQNTPTGWVLSPEDWEAIELTREDGATGAYLLSQGPVDRAAQKLWGLPVVVSSVMPAGVALLGDFATSARIYAREDVQLAWSDATYRSDGAGGGSTDFQRNQLIWRAEERLGLAVLRPSAFTQVDLTAA